MVYAARTETSVEKTKLEIERLVTKHGAQGYASSWHGNKAMIGFRMKDRAVRFVLILPPANDPKFRAGRSQKAAEERWAQACRESWRAMLLVIKGKLEAAATGIETFEESFLAHIVMPDSGRTVWESVREPIKLTYEGRQDVPLLPGAAHAED